MAWNKATPLGTDALKTVDDNIREMKAALETALQVEHEFPVDVNNPQVVHKEGSARIQSGLDADKPSSLPANKLYWATDTKRMYRGTGAGIEDITAIPRGAIIMWSGSVTNIPSGWALCDGTNGTPDLRDRFIVGAGQSYSVGQTGGQTTHIHSVSGTTGGAIGSHKAVYDWGSSGIDAPHYTHTHNFSTSTESADNRPPYYALAFIMKL